MNNCQVPSSSRRLYYRRSTVAGVQQTVEPEPFMPHLVEDEPAEPDPVEEVEEPAAAQVPQPEDVAEEAEAPAAEEAVLLREINEINRAMDKGYCSDDSDYCSDFQDEDTNENFIHRFARTSNLQRNGIS
jgi:hypothetical protein